MKGGFQDIKEHPFCEGLDWEHPERLRVKTEPRPFDREAHEWLYRGRSCSLAARRGRTRRRGPSSTGSEKRAGEQKVSRVRTTLFFVVVGRDCFQSSLGASDSARHCAAITEVPLPKAYPVARKYFTKTQIILY